MILPSIEEEFKRKVCEQVRLVPEGLNRYVVLTPFMFDDGDHLSILLKPTDGGWYLTDEAHTFMHVSYDEIDIERGTRSRIVDTVLLSYGIRNEEGELKLFVKGDAYGDALYSFIQGLIKITDVSYLTRERVRSAFMDDFKAFLAEKVPETRRVFDYSDPQHDPQKKYVVDCRINGDRRPLYVFAIPNDAKCRDATITCLRHERFGTQFVATGIFENQEEINPRVLARFSDVCEKQFPSLQSARERFQSYWKGLAGE